MKRSLAWAALLLVMSSGVAMGCNSNSDEPTARLDEAAEGSADAEHFGDAIDDSIPLTQLGAIVDAPGDFEGQVVRTRGEIARVCQARGCWMELREGENGPAVRVPMAGHSFFLPMDSAGRQAEMQGRVVVRELSPEVREHLESEGALATASALSIEASGVAID